MKVLQIQGVFSPEHGGPTHSLRNYSVALQKRHHEVSAYVLDGWPGFSAVESMPAPIRTISAKVDKPYSLGRSSELKQLLRSSDDADLFHLHGTWLRAMHYGAVEARRRKIPYVLELMGMYEPYGLKQKWLKKKVARIWFQDRDIARANCLHVNSNSEGQGLRKLGFKAPIAVIPVGVDTDRIAEHQANQSEMLSIDSLAGQPFFLFLSRIHPKKGVDMLLHAWAKIASKYPDTKLALTGDGEPNYIEQLKNSAKKLGIADRCVWTGSVDEKQKAWLFFNAKFMVLPTFSENFGNVVPEALAHGTPVLTTTGTPWSDIATENCGWYVAPTTQTIEQGIVQALSVTDQELKKMGQAGKAWCESQFSLNCTADSIDSVYRWLVDGACKPGCLLD